MKTRFLMGVNNTPCIQFDNITYSVHALGPEGLRDFANMAPRKDLIAYCVWNDPNGCYTDKDCKLEFGQPTETETLRAIVRGWADDQQNGVT